MRILQLHNRHAGKGGAMEVVAHEGDLLRRGGHQVEQLTLAAAQHMNLTGLRAGAKAIWNREAAAELDHRISVFGPDIVHVHTPFPLMSPVVFRVAHARGVPAVTTLHSYRYSCVAGTCWRDGHTCEDCVGKSLKLPGLRHRCYHDSLRASGALTASLVLHRSLGTFDHHVSRYLALTEFSRRLLVHDGIPPGLVVVKPNSVPDPGFVAAPRANERRIAFFGRLLGIKGVRTLLDAWALVPAGARLVLAGDGPLRPLVEDRVRQDPTIEYLDWLDEAKVLAQMAAAEVVVVPSEWYEGQPLVVLRSLAVGTPVLVSDLENLAESVVTDNAGWTFRVGDVDALAERLSSLVSSPGLTQSRRQAARQSYDNRYSPQQNLQRLEKIYTSVAA